VKKKYLSEYDKINCWDYDKNKNLDPSKLTYGSHKLAWWKCNKCDQSYKKSIKEQLKHKLCPFCSNKKVYEGNCLLNLYPEISKEWDYNKNDLKPNNVVSGSNRKVWWKCSKCNQEWEAPIFKRTLYNYGCPYCSNRKVSKKNCLSSTNPELLKEWWYEKNIIKPHNITAGSGKKVWWKCLNCKEKYKIIIHRKVSGRGCPYCINIKISKKNCLSATHPEIASEWNYDKNRLTPDDVVSGSNKKVWWKCNKCNQEWSTKIQHRTLSNSNCPFCSNQKVYNGNCLETLYPDVAKEWNYNKNDLTPKDVVYGSNKKVWWICKNSHEWKTDVYSRTISKTLCKKCSNNVSKTSQKWLNKMEEIYGKIEREFPIKTKKRVYNVDGFSKKHNIIFSYHGNYWHGNPEIYDLNEYNNVAKKTFRELYLDTLIRAQYLKAEGYCVIEKWGK